MVGADRPFDSMFEVTNDSHTVLHLSQMRLMCLSRGIELASKGGAQKRFSARIMDSNRQDRSIIG